MENTILSLQNKLKIHKAIIYVLSGFLLAMVLFFIFYKKTSQSANKGHLEPIRVDSIVHNETIYVEVPKNVLDAYEELIALGFDKFLIKT